MSFPPDQESTSAPSSPAGPSQSGKPPTKNRRAVAIAGQTSEAAPFAPRRATLPPPHEPQIIAPAGPYSAPGFTVLPEEAGQSNELLAALQKAAVWVFWASLAITVLLLFNLVFDVSKGSQTKLAQNPNASGITTYLYVMAVAVTASLTTLSLSYLVLTWEDDSAGGILAGVGLLLHIIVPWLIFATAGRTPATAAVAQGFRTAGFILTVLGGLKLAWSSYVWLKKMPDRMHDRASVGIPNSARTQASEAAFANVFSPCWQLSYCRDVIRRQCPAYLAKTKCWKFGKGCFCDEAMINKIIAGDQLSATYRGTRTTHSARRPGSKPPCKQCYIYLEHQGHKLRWVSPLALPLAVGLTFMIWPLYSLIWKTFGYALGWIWALISFSPVHIMGPQPKGGAPVGQLGPDEVSALAQNLGGIFIGFFLLLVILRLTEMAIDRWGW